MASSSVRSVGMVFIPCPSSPWYHRFIGGVCLHGGYALLCVTPVLFRLIGKACCVVFIPRFAFPRTYFVELLVRCVCAMSHVALRLTSTTPVDRWRMCAWHLCLALRHPGSVPVDWSGVQDGAHSVLRLTLAFLQSSIMDGSSSFHAGTPCLKQRQQVVRFPPLSVRPRSFWYASVLE